jgi:small-conductance mechanosensitive channel
VVIFFNLLYHVFDEVLRWYLDHQQESKPLITKNMLPIAEKITLLLLICIALIIILKHFHYDPLSIITALGIGSLAIGLAAKDTLANMISGFTLMLDQPFHIGDRVRLANGNVGDVVDIGLRTTKIQALDGAVLVIPNSDLCNSTVINMMRPTAISQGRVTLGVDYSSDMERVKVLLLDIARRNPEVLSDPAPSAFFTAFGDSALTVLLLFWINDPTGLTRVTDQLNSAILKRFSEEGINIPFPTRTVIMDRSLEPKA